MLHDHASRQQGHSQDSELGAPEWSFWAEGTAYVPPTQRASRLRTISGHSGEKGAFRILGRSLNAVEPSLGASYADQLINYLHIRLPGKDHFVASVEF